ncbi:MAG: T9SS type A sorting domain-containing protein [Chitinophagales bacterium]
MKNLILLTALIFSIYHSYALKVTNFSGTYRNGQVFFTWTLDAGTGSVYKLYRSATQITSGSQLSSCEYLGLTDRNSSTNNNLSAADNLTRYWIIKDGTSPLTSGQGLFVTTCVANTSYYYALTVTLETEDKKIVIGANSLAAPIAETVAPPQPVLQETRIINGYPVDIYGDFYSSRDTLNGPLEMYAGWLGYDFAVFRNQDAPSPHALHVRFHAGGTNFLNKITNTTHDEVNLGVEDFFPDGDNSAWIGSHKNFNPYIISLNTPPATGTNYFYTHKRLIREIKWAEANCNVDTNRIYADGNSFGCNGVFLLLLLHPELFAAVDLTGGLFNFGFTTDYNPETTMNTGKKNRNDGDKLLGTVSTNLQVGYYTDHTYDLLNAGRMIHQHNEEKYPVIYSINGRKDDAMGWTEKPIWYDSVENNHLGGFYFFDNRDHTGLNRFWSSNNYDMFRYYRNVSYPAFSYCNVNSNPGNGHSNNGDSVGSINGFLDWKTTAADITDLPTQWAVTIFMKNLNQQFGGITYSPDSCIANISLRRVQQFLPLPGSVLNWSVTHKGQQVQSGSLTYSGGLITVPGVKIYEDTIIFSVSSLNTYYADADNDGFGNKNVSIAAAVKPAGYVSNFTDCNDANAAINPDANETCNSIDDDCDGIIDDSTFVASLSPSGTVSACSSANVKFMANMGTGLSYKWYKDGIIIPGETTRNYKTNGSESGTYQVKETNLSGCIARSPIANLTRIENPLAKINVTGDLNICLTGTVQLKAKNGTGISWQWNKNGIIISGATKQKYNATAVGNYTVKVTSASGCTNTSDPVTVFISCRQSNLLASQAFEAHIYPNPAQDHLLIQMNNAGNGNLQLDLMNLLGQKLISKMVNIDSDDSSIELSLIGIPDGMYFLKTEMNGVSIVTAVVIKNE